jgi:tripartite-type tricarboxylate transporter receptor subunit TctC
VPQVRQGRVRGLAVTSAQPTPLAPELPTMAAAGLPGCENAFTPGMFVRTGTPEAIIERLNREIGRALLRPEVREKMLTLGLEPMPSSPDEFSAAIRQELKVLGKVIRDAGIRED